MTHLAPEAKPALRNGCRLDESDGAALLVPEGLIRLKGAGAAILRRCDGRSTVVEIIRGLQSEFVRSDPDRIAREVQEFLGRLHEKGVLRFL